MKLKHMKKTFLIPVILVLLFSAMNFFPFYTAGEHFFFDLFLHFTPGAPEDEKIVLLNIDDLAIARVGMFPWSRSIMADGLILMKEMGASSAVFDIEYTEESPMGLNGEFLRDEIPKTLDRQFNDISDNTTGLFQAIASGNISIDEASDYIYQLSDMNQEAKQELLSKINAIARDNDAYLGEAARYFEKAFFTVNMLSQKEEEYSAELKTWVRENRSIKVTADANSLHLKAIDIRPAVAPITMNGASLGFPNVAIDSDGVRRRVNLVGEYDGVFFPQLSFQAVYDLFGKPEIISHKDNIILKNAKMPNGEVKDIKIPLDPKGYFIINWPRKEFEQSFTQLSYYYLVLHKEQEKLLIQNLETMSGAGYLKYYQGDSPLLGLYDYALSLSNDMLSGGKLDQMEDFREIRNYFFSEAASFLNGDARGNITSRIDQLLASPDVADAQKEKYREIRTSVITSFTETAGVLNNLLETRRTLSEKLNGAICYLGWTGTATTDRGVNPFDATYDNVGTHASIANTIINESFLDVLPQWPSVILTILLVFVYYRIKIKLNPVQGILTGLAFIIFIFISSLLLFRFTGSFFPIMTPVMATSASFITLTIVSFLSTSKEKTFIRNAFGQYLSNEVINDLLDNPEKLNLGGEKKNLTAIFTDVQGFSTISEAMDPTDLVNLLNMYLTEMSDIIMDQLGTIDKFEGDAIISFFGAPADIKDHAYRACLSAVTMKRAEHLMNVKIKEEKLSPYPLLTRIGINTGDMVVGNMGTAKKMDYTMMGNAVNLAARLEGVNKRYGTWLLMSETTFDAGGKEFATRRLDRVRVVGINTPVRLFELVEEKNKLTAEKKEALAVFDKGLTVFEERDWKAAGDYFKQVQEIDPKDGPASYYRERCETYQKTPPKKEWDGVYNLTEK